MSVDVSRSGSLYFSPGGSFRYMPFSEFPTLHSYVGLSENHIAVI